MVDGIVGWFVVSKGAKFSLLFLSFSTNSWNAYPFLPQTQSGYGLGYSLEYLFSLNTKHLSNFWLDI
jgi:hypothetical protein